MELVVTSREIEWDWDEPFTITDKQAVLSEEAIELEKAGWLSTELIIAIFGLLIVMIIVLLYLLNKQRKQFV